MSGIRFDMNGLQKGLEILESKSDVAIRTFCDTGALKMQTYAQQNAPWTDRTGSARQRLQGGVEKRASGYAIRISHGVDYGIWLELAHEKRFAILPDTLRYVGEEEIMPAFEKFMERLSV